MTPGQQVEVTITTQSQVMQNYQPSGTPPKITLNGQPFPLPQGKQPWAPSGLQVAVLNPTEDITNPASIISNQYVMLPNDSGSWMNVYQYMWQRTQLQLVTSGDPDQQIVLIASFGLDANVPPTAAIIAILLELGAGPQLQQWATSVDTGSQSSYWVAFPANYVLIGNPEYGYGQGTEAYQSAGQNNSVTTTVSATLTNAA